VLGVLAAPAESGGAFMVSNEGKGTIRLFSGFSANKAPGSSGKTLMKAEELVGVQAVAEQDDVFIVSRLGKIIRFAAAEVPAKEGVVQGVNCMALRADECVALAVSPGS
jgi:DNA gyrase/topoisomerase IV subunit A